MSTVAIQGLGNIQPESNGSIRRTRTSLPVKRVETSAGRQAAATENTSEGKPSLANGLRGIASSAAEAQTTITRASIGLDRLGAIRSALQQLGEKPGESDLYNLRESVDTARFQGTPVFDDATAEQLRLPDDGRSLDERLAAARQAADQAENGFRSDIDNSERHLARLDVERANLTAAFNPGRDINSQALAERLAEVNRPGAVNPLDPTRVLHLVEE